MPLQPTEADAPLEPYLQMSFARIVWPQGEKIQAQTNSGRLASALCIDKEPAEGIICAQQKSLAWLILCRDIFCAYSVFMYFCMTI